MVTLPSNRDQKIKSLWYIFQQPCLLSMCPWAGRQVSSHSLYPSASFTAIIQYIVNGLSYSIFIQHMFVLIICFNWQYMSGQCVWSNGEHIQTMQGNSSISSQVGTIGRQTDGHRWLGSTNKSTKQLCNIETSTVWLCVCGREAGRGATGLNRKWDAGEGGQGRPGNWSRWGQPGDGKGGKGSEGAWEIGTVAKE